MPTPELERASPLRFAPHRFPRAPLSADSDLNPCASVCARTAHARAVRGKAARGRGAQRVAFTCSSPLLRPKLCAQPPALHNSLSLKAAAKLQPLIRPSRFFGSFGFVSFLADEQNKERKFLFISLISLIVRSRCASEVRTTSERANKRTHTHAHTKA